MLVYVQAVTVKLQSVRAGGWEEPELCIEDAVRPDRQVSSTGRLRDGRIQTLLQRFNALYHRLAPRLFHIYVMPGAG